MNFVKDADVHLVGNKKQDEISIYIGARTNYVTKNYCSMPYIRDFYDIELCLSGSLTLYLNDVPYEISAGMLYVTPPYTKAVRHFHEEGSSTAYIGAKGSALKRYLNILGFSDTSIIFPYPLTQLCKDSFISIIDSLETSGCFTAYSLTEDPEHGVIQNKDYSNHFSFEANLRQKGYFSLFMAELMRIKGTNSDQSAEKTMQQEYINSAINYIEANYARGISVDGIAKHIGINRSYLFKLFREELGMSVQEYIVHTRMKMACKLLRHPNAQINVVASSLGYEVCSFSRIFKKTVGMSPMEYRKEHQRNDL